MGPKCLCRPSATDRLCDKNILDFLDSDLHHPSIVALCACLRHLWLCATADSQDPASRPDASSGNLSYDAHS